MKKSILLFMMASALTLISACAGSTVKTGETLPAWEEGELDIHFINTGRGECAYQIFPDGTTMLSDASGSLLKPGVKDSDPLPARPSPAVSAGKVIVD